MNDTNCHGAATFWTAQWINWNKLEQLPVRLNGADEDVGPPSAGLVVPPLDRLSAICSEGAEGHFNHTHCTGLAPPGRMVEQMKAKG